MQPFIGTDDLAAILGRPVSDADLITSIALDSGCQAVRDYTGQLINYVANDIETVDGHGTKKIRLTQRPVRGLTSVMLDGEIVDPALYNRQGALIRRTDDIRWPVGYAVIQVTYSHGYDIEPDNDASDDVLVPPTMRLVALLVAKRVYMSQGSQTATIQSEGIGSYNYSVSTTGSVESVSQLLDAEKAVLEHFRVGLVPAR